MRIPTPANRGQQTGSVTVDPLQPVFQNVQFANNQELAQNLQSLGNTAGNVAQVLNKRQSDNAMRQAEVDYLAFEREILDPNTGIFTRRGANAAGVSGDVQQRFDEFSQGIKSNSSGLSRSGRAAIDQMLSGAGQRLWKNAANHELDQTYAYEQTLIGAQLEGQADRAANLYTMPEELGAAMGQVATLAGDLADAQGLDGEAREQFIQQKTSEAHGSVVQRMLNDRDAAGAEGYVKAAIAQGTMDPTAGNDLLANIIPAARKELAGEIAGGIFNGVPVSAAGGGHGATPRRQFINRMIGSESSGDAGVQRTNEDGRSFVGLGQVGEARLQDMKNAGIVPADVPLEEFGSAANEQLQRDALEWHFADIDKAIERTGALSQGFSLDGLRAVAHLGGQGAMREFVRTNGGNGATADELGTSLQDYYDKFSGTQEITRVSDIEDPLLRAEVQSSLETMQATEYTQRNRASAALQDKVMSEIFTEDLRRRQNPQEALGPIDFQQMMLDNPAMSDLLGDKLSTIQTFVDKLNRGETIVTVPETYGELVTTKETDPEAFLQENLLDYVNELDASTLKGLQDDQAELRGETLRGENGMALVSKSDVDDAVGLMFNIPNRDAAGRDVLKNSVRNWANDMMEQTGKRPTPLQMMNFGQTVLANEQFSTKQAVSGAGNLRGHNFVETVARIDEDGILNYIEEDEDLELTLPTTGGSETIGVTKAERQEVFAELLNRLGRTPTADDFLTALILRNTRLFNP